MPTATGKPTADEKREAERLANREARLSVTISVASPDWYEAEADAFVRGLAEHRAGQEAGTVKSYDRFEVLYSAGIEHEVKVGRRTIKVDEGQARAYGVADVLHARGIRVHNMLSFGTFTGRQSIRHHVTDGG